jgi:hypothetical protein
MKFTTVSVLALMTAVLVAPVPNAENTVAKRDYAEYGTYDAPATGVST